MHNVCLVLTDGEPNEHPSSGYEAAQERFRNDPDFSYVLNTMAFGYGAMDSRLLKAMALQGNGTFVNIPDSGLIGTVFTNMIAAAACTTHRQLRLVDLKQCLDSRRPCYGDFPWNAATATLELGNIQAGQDRTVLLRLAPGVRCADLAVKIEAVPVQCLEPQCASELLLGKGRPLLASARAAVPDVLRAKASDLLLELLVLMAGTKHEAAAALLETFLTVQRVREEDPRLFVDLNEQVRQALAPDAFKRWGHTYLPSLGMAYDHRLVSACCRGGGAKGAWAARARAHPGCVWLVCSGTTLRTPACSTLAGPSSDGWPPPCPISTTRCRCPRARGRQGGRSPAQPC
jgi:hypothetical protein